LRKQTVGFLWLAKWREKTDRDREQRLGEPVLCNSRAYCKLLQGTRVLDYVWLPTITNLELPAKKARNC